MKINHMICPTCGHDFYTDCAYARCDSCQTVFYASESQTNKLKKKELLCQHCLVPRNPISSFNNCIGCGNNKF